jgi:hypothetical protein
MPENDVSVENLGGLYFCLELSRQNYAAVVYLYRRRANLAVDLWNQLHRAAPNTAYCEDNSLIFSRPVLEDEIPEFSEHLSRNLDEFIAFMSGCGGLKKYLPRTP